MSDVVLPRRFRLAEDAILYLREQLEIEHQTAQDDRREAVGGDKAYFQGKADGYEDAIALIESLEWEKS